MEYNLNIRVVMNDDILCLLGVYDKKSNVNRTKTIDTAKRISRIKTIEHDQTSILYIYIDIYVLRYSDYYTLVKDKM